MAQVQITLIGKPGCHLCDDAREVIDRVARSLTDPTRSRGRVDLDIEELSILDDEDLDRRYSEYIPVVLIGGKRHAIWRVDEAKLRTAVEKAARKWKLF